MQLPSDGKQICISLISRIDFPYLQTILRVACSFQETCIEHALQLGKPVKARFAIKDMRFTTLQTEYRPLNWKLLTFVIVSVDLTVASYTVSAYNEGLRLLMGLRLKKVSPHCALLPYRDYVKRQKTV